MTWTLGSGGGAVF